MQTRTDNVASFIRAALWGPSLPFSTHPLLVTSLDRGEHGTTQSFLSFTLFETLFIFLLSLTSPRNKNQPRGTEEDRGGQRSCRRRRRGYLFKKQLYSKKCFSAIWIARHRGERLSSFCAGVNGSAPLPVTRCLFSTSRRLERFDGNAR